PLGKFDGKADEGFLVGYSINSKAFRVFNSRTRIVQKTLHINFLENKHNVAWIGPTWMFDIDTLTKSMNYQPVVAGNQPNDNACIKENLDADPQNIDDDVVFDVKENENDVHVSTSESDMTDSMKHDEKATRDDKGKSPVGSPIGVRDLRDEFEEFSFNSTSKVNAINAPVNAAWPNPTNNTNNFNIASPSDTAISPNFGIAGKSSFIDPSKYPDDPDMPEFKDIVYSDDEEDIGAEADFSNLETISVKPIPTTRVHKDHPVNQIIGDLNSAPQTRSMARVVKEQEDVGAEADFSNLEINITICPIPTTRVHKYHTVTQILGELSSAPQTRSMTRMVKEQGGLTQINDNDFHTCMFACFLSQEEPNRKNPKGYTKLLKIPAGLKLYKRSFFNSRCKRNKARLVAQGHTQEKGIDYKEVFAPVTRIEAIRFFLAYASFMGFMVYQMDVKSAFFYETIEEEVYVCQPLGFKDPDYPDKVYKVVKALYGLHQAPRAWYETLANHLLKNGF
nr:hypothetical protein [Tanacetum cinerariifolium]